MTNNAKFSLSDTARSFRLPRYQEIPNVGLYLEQVAKYISECLQPLQEGTVTSSMISNYVKKGLVPNPVRKQYDRNQIAHLLFIALAKSVVSLDDLARLIRLQERTYTVETAYNYFCLELENMLQFTFGLKEEPDHVGSDSTEEKFLLRSAIITITYKIYLDKCFQALATEEQE